MTTMHITISILNETIQGNSNAVLNELMQCPTAQIVNGLSTFRCKRERKKTGYPCPCFLLALIKMRMVVRGVCFVATFLGSWDGIHIKCDSLKLISVSRDTLDLFIPSSYV